MKKLLLVICLFAAVSCSKDDDSSGNNNNQNPPPGSCGTSSGYTLYKDSEGCYYNDSYGSKVYVADNLCNC